MGAYNTFVARVPAAGGSGTVECRLQSNVGLLEFTDIEQGQPILPAPIESLKGIIAPNMEALRGDRPFWSYGIGTCGDDESTEVYARLHFRDGIFVSAELIDCPDDLYDWGFE